MATVKTVVDPRVVDEQGVVLNQYVGPLNWEHYKIPASGLSNTQITFANIVTLGTNRLYDSNFEIEYTIDIKLLGAIGIDQIDDKNFIDSSIRFQPFPLHSVTDQLRTNINGAACMARPQESLLQRMMFWRQAVLDKTCSHCPHDKFTLVDEPAYYWETVSTGNPTRVVRFDSNLNNFLTDYKGSGRSIDKPVPCITSSWDKSTATYSITIREPVLCPPFNQRLDKLYQRPLFNITSIDMVYQLNDLRRMLLPWSIGCVMSNLTADNLPEDKTFEIITTYLSVRPGMCQVNLKSAQLCFNVASLPPGMTVPPVMTLPYYDNVNYVTAYPGTSYTESELITSGVYTLAQVPTAIYIFVSEDQLFRSSVKGDNSLSEDNITLNPSLCPIRDINITMGNNTQLLSTTSELDRYQMCLANGLENTSWEDFTSACQFPPKVWRGTNPKNLFYRNGGKANRCILRLVPGIDLLIPDRRLVGGMDADQMVFQVRVTADLSAVPEGSKGHMALWIMFEYCGVLTIEPVHASIDMIPIKTMPPLAQIDAVADSTVPIVGDTMNGGGEGTGTPAGAGIFGNLLGSIWNGISKLPGLISKGLRGVANWMTSPAAQGSRDMVGSFLGFNPGQNSPWQNQAAYWLGDQIRQYGAPPALQAPTGVRRGPIIEEVNDEPEKKGGRIIGKGKLGKFYV